MKISEKKNILRIFDHMMYFSSFFFFIIFITMNNSKSYLDLDDIYFGEKYDETLNLPHNG